MEEKIGGGEFQKTRREHVREARIMRNDDQAGRAGEVETASASEAGASGLSARPYVDGPNVSRENVMKKQKQVLQSYVRPVCVA